MTVAVIIATGRAAGPGDPRPAAALPWGSGPEAPTLLARLRKQLAGLNVPDPQVLTRPEFAPLLRKDGHDVTECADPAADLTEIARLARRGAGAPLLLLPGDLAISTELLTRLIRDAKGPAAALAVPLAPPDPPTGAPTTGPPNDRPPVRVIPSPTPTEPTTPEPTEPRTSAPEPAAPTPEPTTPTTGPGTPGPGTPGPGTLASAPSTASPASAVPGPASAVPGPASAVPGPASAVPGPASGPATAASGAEAASPASASAAPGPAPIASGPEVVASGAVRPGGHGTAVVRVERGRIVSAGSPRHRVSGPNAASPGVLRVGRTRLEELAEIAERLAILLEVPGAMPLLPDAAREAEAVELLLVGLVRSGVPVADHSDPRLACVRADDQHAAHAAHAAVTAVDEDRVRLRAAVKDDDGFFATYAVSGYSPFLVRLAARRGLTPNTVTCMSMGLAVLAAVWFADGTRAGMVIGAALFHLSFVLDCVDGQLARYTRRFSPLGAWLDAVFDRAKEYAVYAGLAVGAGVAAVGDPVHAGDVWPLAVAAMALQTVRHMIDFSFGARAESPPDPPRVIPLTVRDDARDPGPEPGGVARLSARTSRVRALHWAKKTVTLPIGERFALVAVTAAVGNARWTFTALLLWGGLAAAYTLTGRVLRTISR
ncbi:CDP-alcohol phosphatidyltransferase family protein [Actinomadura kijaniata]|uniref:CDP-alcohol phosphatidyltransferase family protein n=1 Tax=Actinomadura kijaniata TaxID=46161 RepID=UPI00082C6B35|nr:CDP-alcohol phosphatidyltransferase family protein [Actinomadura kijaniata]